MGNFLPPFKPSTEVSVIRWESARCACPGGGGGAWTGSARIGCLLASWEATTVVCLLGKTKARAERYMRSLSLRRDLLLLRILRKGKVFCWLSESSNDPGYDAKGSLWCSRVQMASYRPCWVVGWGGADLFSSGDLRWIPKATV